MIIKTDRFCSKKLKALIYEQEGWEIYRTVTNSTLLIVVRSIYEEWIEDRVLFSVDPFKISNIDGVEYAYLFSPKQFVLVPVKNGIPFCDGRIAIAFAAALKQIRKYFHHLHLKLHYLLPKRRRRYFQFHYNLHYLNLYLQEYFLRQLYFLHIKASLHL